MGEMWRADYETENFQDDVQRLWKEVMPLYNKLHAYAKKKLQKVYKDDMPSGDFIPAHILGNFKTKKSF
jgi:peptidyl-dipeptidase A